VKKIHLNLYSGYNYRGHKFAKVLKKLYNEIYLSNIKNNKAKTAYKYNNLDSQIKIKPLYLKYNNYFACTLRHLIYFKNKRVETVSIHNLGLMPMGIILKYFFKAKAIYEPHELETETIDKRNLKKFISKIIERICIKFVDHTIVVSPSIAKWYQKKYNISKPTVIYNSRNNYYYKKKNIFREKFKIKKNKTIYLYNGNLNKKGRGITLILDAFSKNDNKNNVIIFMGSGDFDKEIKSIAKKEENIFYHKSVPTQNLHLYTSSADVGICLIENTCLNENYCLPNKLFEYLSGHIPVIVSNLYELKKFIKANQCGFIFNLEKDNLETYLNKNINKKSLHTKLNYIKKTASIYDWKFEEAKIFKVYEKILK